MTLIIIKKIININRPLFVLVNSILIAFREFHLTFSLPTYMENDAINRTFLFATCCHVDNVCLHIS